MNSTLATPPALLYPSKSGSNRNNFPGNSDIDKTHMDEHAFLILATKIQISISYSNKCLLDECNYCIGSLHWIIIYSLSINYKTMLVEGQKGWKWQDSRSKKKLLRMIHRGEIGHDVRPKDVYLMHPLFAEEVTYNKNWASRVRACREQIKGAHRQALEEASGLAHDRHIFPVTTHNTNGKPHWNGSAAEQIVRNAVLRLFQNVVVEGIACKEFNGSTMPSNAVRALRKDNPSLQLFDHWEVYGHANQEIKRLKFFNYRALKTALKQKKAAERQKKKKTRK